MSENSLKKKKYHQRTEEDWQAIHDANTVAAAEKIKADAARMKQAKRWAAVLVEEENEDFEAMRKIADSE